MEVVAGSQRRKHLRKSKAQLVDELMAFEGRLADAEGDRCEGGVADERPFSLVDNFFKNSPFMFSVKDAEGRYVMVNNKWEEMAATTFEEVRGRRPEEVFPKSAYSETLSDQSIVHDEDVMETLKSVIKEEKIVITDESYVFQTIKFPLFEDKGAIQGIATIATDITEQKRVEEALRESEERFRILFEHAPEAITILDVDTGFYVDANPMAETLHGYPREELIGKIGPENLSPEIQLDGRPSSEAAADYLSRALAGQFPRFDWMHLTPDGQENLCEVSLTRLPDPHHNLVRACVIDITERKQMEEALRESEERLRIIIDTVPAFINVKDRDHRYVLSNRYHTGLCGSIEKNIIGQTSDIISKEHGKRMKELERSVMESGEILPYYDDSFIMGDKKFELLVTKAPLKDMTGNIIGIVSSSIDVTERRELERLVEAEKKFFHDAIENLQEAFALFDNDDRLVTWNEKYIEMLALDEEFVKKGAAFEDLLRENVKRKRVVQSVGRGEEFIRERLEMHKNPSGPFELILNNGRNLLASEAKTLEGGTYITLTDITKLKQTEQQAREREAELANIRRLNVLGEMAAAVAHELNQPLAVISSYAQGVATKLRAGTVSPDELLEPIENLVEQADRAAEIIASIRSVVGNQKIKKTAIDLNATIEEALVIIRSECQAQGVKVTLDFEDGLPSVMADKIQVQQLVLNLVRNALEAISESPTAASDVMIRSSLNGGDTIEFEVKDTGPGISLENPSDIFTPFYTTKTQGLGLGLFICRSITEAHGGRIWMQPVSGKGTAIRCSLPIGNDRTL